MPQAAMLPGGKTHVATADAILGGAPDPLRRDALVARGWVLVAHTSIIAGKATGDPPAVRTKRVRKPTPLASADTPDPQKWKRVKPVEENMSPDRLRARNLAHAISLAEEFFPIAVVAAALSMQQRDQLAMCWSRYRRELSKGG